MTHVKVPRRMTMTNEPWRALVMVDGVPLQLSLETVGPDEATKMLGYNLHNRPLKDANVKKFAGDMVNGDWAFDGAPIRFAEDGVLLDGQNRLHAVVAAGVAVEFLVIRGLPSGTQDVMDTGAIRSFGDVLALKGETNSTALAALVRQVAAWEDGARRNLAQWKASHKVLERVLAEHPDLREYPQQARRVARVLGLNPSAVGMLWWVFDRIDVEDSAAFFDRLETGQGESERDPVRRLHRALLDDTKVKGGNANTQRQIVFIIKGWNAYREGREVGMYRWRPGGATPETFPEPI